MSKIEKKTLTDRTLRGLKPADPGSRYDVWDGAVPGLGVRVTEKGTRTFFLATRYPGSNNPARRALGVYGAITLDTARTKARDWLTKIEKGVDPSRVAEADRLAELRKSENTFGSVAEAFFAHVKRQGQRTAKITERDVKREFVSIWGRRPITEITRSDVVGAINKIVVDRESPYRARNMLGMVTRLFDWAISTDAYGLESSPCDRLKPKKLCGKLSLRTRILSNEEILVFWKATDRMGYPFGTLFKLLLITLQRRGECAGAQRKELDIVSGSWSIPAERMKMNAPHFVPLSTMAADVFKSLPEFKGGEFLFSTTHGKSAVQGFSKAKARLDQLMLQIMSEEARERGVSEADIAKIELRPFVVHDLRRTGRTHLSSLPIPDLVRELVIAHAKPGLHKVYDQHAYADEKRRALELWAARLRSIVEPQSGNVIELAKARAQ